MKSLLSDSQWLWVAARIREGYQIKELAAFLGLHRDTVQRGLIRMGIRMSHDELPPLAERRQEFQALAGEDYRAWIEKTRQAQ